MHKTSKYIFVVLLSMLFVVGCGRTPKVQSEVVYKSVTKVYIASNIPVDKFIAQNIQDECSLDSRLLDNLKKIAESEDIEVVTDSKANRKENTLKLEILDAVSAGNAFMGHRKFVVAGGKLYEGDKKIASFKVARASGGGFFGSYKSSCAVLGGCTVSMAKDIVKWLKAPIDNAILGDRRLLRNK